MRKRIQSYKKGSRKKQHTPWPDKLKITTVVLNFLYVVYKIAKEMFS